MTGLRWAARMALRDARHGWRRMAVTACATAAGIAALVAAGAFRSNIETAIRAQARPLLSADAVVRLRRPFTAAEDAHLRALPCRQIREIEINTVAAFPSAQREALVEVRAVETGFPLYGDVKTAPKTAFGELFTGASAVVEESAMTEFGLQAGDTVTVGGTAFRIAGTLAMVPGEAMASAMSAPTVFIDIARLPATGLLEDSSLARHRAFFQFRDAREEREAVAHINAFPGDRTLRLITVEDQQKSLGRRAANATRFLKLAALVALLLGGVGVAGIMTLHARERRATAATLRCLGAPARPLLAVFTFQAAALGAVGTALGLALGAAAAHQLPALLKSLMNIELPGRVPWRAAAEAGAVGFGVTALFTLIPLLPLRRVPPLTALRAGGTPARPAWRDSLIWAAGGALALVLGAYVASLGTRPALAAAVPMGLLAAMSALVALTRVALRIVRRATPAALPYAWRQGLSGLHRPGNQAAVLVPALGLGAALIFFVAFVNTSLVRQLSLSSEGATPTMGLIDIQPGQREGVRALLAELGAPLTDEAAFVTMRLESIKGRPVAEIRNDTASTIPMWTLTREYRSTYRNTVAASERVIKGAWPPPAREPGGPVPVSFEADIAKDLGLDVGDELIFNVQGVAMPARVAALRSVDWFQLRPNFFAVFPEGVLEDAPQFTIMLAQAPGADAVAAVQKAVRGAFPNVSAVDLRMVMETLSGYFDRIRLALQALSLVVVAAGVLILAGVLVSGRGERIKEAALLRTLGAPARLVRVVHVIEYAALGLAAGLAGLLIGGAGAWGVTERMFEIPFRIDAVAATAGLTVMTGLSVVAGVLLGRGTLNRPPLETLREEE